MKHFLGAIVALILLSGLVYGAQQKAPFNLREVMAKVAHHPRMDGDHIVIGGQVYRASFDGSEVILTSRDGKHRYRVPIGEEAELYVRDGKVCYETPEGEIQFSGSRCGLRYQRVINNPGFRKYLGDMAIRMNGRRDLVHPDRFALYDDLDRKVPYRANQGSLWISQKNLASLQFSLTLDGEFLIDTTTVYVPAPDDQWYPSVAFDGTNYLVVWEDSRGLDWDIYGARVDQSGEVLDPAGIAICTAAYDQRVPSIAFDGTNYLVVWEDNRNGYCDIYGARVDQSGEVLDPPGIAISPAAYEPRLPSIAFDGTNYLVVWEDYRIGSVEGDIYGARLDQSGVVLDPAGIAICTAADWQGFPSVAFDGTNYLVVWDDCRSGSDWDIYGARVNQSGTVIDSFAVSLQSGNQISPALIHGTGDQLLLTYSGWTPVINEHPANKMRIWGKFYPFTGVEDEPTQGPLPQRFSLEQNYPNPFNSTTAISYQLSAVNHQLAADGGRPTAVTLRVYNILGQEVRTLVDEEQGIGNYRVLWDGRDNSGKEVSSGVYFYRLKAGRFVQTRKMVMLR